MNHLRLEVSLGDDTTAVMRRLLAELENEDTDAFEALEVDWKTPESPGLAGEPISLAVVLGGSAMVISMVLRLLERRMEHLQQREMMRLIAEGFEQSPELAERLEAAARTYSNVSISYGLAKEGWATPQ